MIPKIYILNLEKRIDRRNHMINLLEKSGISNYQFVRPIPASESLITKLISDRIISPNNKHINLYKASHTLTYLNLLQTVPEEQFIIMEDDLGTDIPLTDLRRQIENTIASTPSNYDVIYFEYCHEYCSYKNCNSCRLNKPICLGATMWNKSSAYRVANMFNNEFGNIDHWIANYINNGLINAYGPYPPIFYQKEIFGTDLPQDTSYFLRRSIFKENNRACIQSEITSVLSKIALVVISYKILT